MSITFNELLARRERLQDVMSEEAAALCTLIETREAELRSRIAEMIAIVSQRENWKLHRCAATARRVEETEADRLESIYEYFHHRSLENSKLEVPDLANAAGNAAQIEVTQVASISLTLQNIVDVSPDVTAGPVVALHGRMRSLESLVAPTPGIGGVQGVRIMRVVALMSKARSAHLAKRRISGTQLVYHHN